MTIETTDPGVIEVLPPARPAQADAVGQLMAHAQAMSAAKQLADALCDSELVPAIYRGKPGNGAAAILYGAELGLNPIQSLQQIFVVHGAPAIYARTAVALVMRHGITVRTIESGNDSVTVQVSDPRTGHVETCTWDIARATKAGYTSNKKYDTNPQEMLYAKAAMEGCRKVAPDILLGIPMSREELELEAPPVKVQSERVRGMAALREAAAAAKAEPEPAQPTATVVGLSASARKKWVESLERMWTQADVLDVGDQLTVVTAILDGRRPEPGNQLPDADLRTVVNKLDEWHKKGDTEAQVREILNAAALSDANKSEQSEGK
jgi:hypothetical protein